MKKKILLTSILTIALCVSLIAGSTFALFTTADEINVAVTAGNVHLTANIDKDSLLTWSLGETEVDARTDGLFANGGKATVDSIGAGDTDGDGYDDPALLTIVRMTPGDTAKFKIDVKNESNVNVQYRLRMISLAGAHEVDLTETLVTTAYVDGFNYVISNASQNAANPADYKTTPWAFADANEEIGDIWVTVHFPCRDDRLWPELEDIRDNTDNKYQNAQAEIAFVVEAVQGNANTFINNFKTVEEVMVTNQNGTPVLNGGIYNGEGKIYTLKGNTEVKDVTLANMTVKGTKGSGTLIPHADDGQLHTLTLADGAIVYAVPGGHAVHMIFRAHTLMVNEGAKIIAEGNSVGIMLDALDSGVYNLVLNGTDLIQAGNTDNGIKIADGAHVNIFVPDTATMNHYQKMFSQANDEGTVHWYVNGTLAKTTRY